MNSEFTDNIDVEMNSEFTDNIDVEMRVSSQTIQLQR